MKKFALFLGFLCMATFSMACTSVLIAGSRTESGLPLLLKHRDTDCQDNRLQWFRPDSIAFVGLVNAPIEDGEVWAGQNQDGFAIINTAVYNFNEDSVTASYQEQLLRHRADSAMWEEKINAVLADSLQLKKVKNVILADTLRNQYIASLDTLRPLFLAEVMAIDSLDSLLVCWLDSMKRHPELREKVAISDKEGELMYQALASCRKVQDFLDLLDSLPRPWGIQANFAMIDSVGGALYVEANNWRYVVYDVNQEPLGYRIQTNFAFAGTKEHTMGYERYETMKDIMRDLDKHFTHQRLGIGHQWLFNHVSRSFRHHKLGLEEGQVSKTGFYADQDFIPRRITSAVVVMEGTTMWAALGYPTCAIAIPALVCDTDRLPAAVKRTETDSCCLMDSIALALKSQYMFPDSISNGLHYVNVGAVLRGTRKQPSLYSCTLKAEDFVNKEFNRIKSLRDKGVLSEQSFYEQYEQIFANPENLYKRYFRKLLKEPQE